MDALTLAYIAAGIITVVLAICGVTYASRSLNLFRRNPELRKIQQKIWLPTLTSGAVITVGAAFDVLSHLILTGFDLEMAHVVHDYVMLAGLVLLLLGISRYWSLQRHYDLAKRRVSEQSVAK